MTNRCRHLPARWIVFDAVGTLIYAKPDVATAYFEIGRRHGSRLSRADAAARFREAFRESECRDHEMTGDKTGRTNEAAEKERWRQIVADVLPDTTSGDACFRDLFAHFSLPESWACFDDVQPTLDVLPQRGVDLAIASNFDARLHSVCDGHSTLAGICHRVVSSEVGYRKPSHSFYDALLDELSASPDEVLMVGDDLENDIRGAESAGIRSVLICREGSPPDGVTFVKSLLELEAVL